MDRTNEPWDDAMTQDRITKADLDWWLKLAATVRWTIAKTYADSAPHSYVVLGRTDGMTADDYVRAGRVIHTFGRPAKFYGMTSIYLTSPDGALKWWTMNANVADTSLINQATTERLYGVQNAPFTDSDVCTEYNDMATAYDALDPMSEETAERVRVAVAGLTGEYTPSILDVGCGTGRVLDLGLTTPDRYAGVDPSQAMLNQLVRKHPGVAAVYPMTVEQALLERVFTPGQFEIVIALISEAERFDAAAFMALGRIASRGLLVCRGGAVVVAEAGSLTEREAFLMCASPSSGPGALEAVDARG